MTTAPDALTQPEIGARMHLSLAALERDLKAARRALGARNTAHAAAEAGKPVHRIIAEARYGAQHGVHR